MDPDILSLLREAQHAASEKINAIHQRMRALEHDAEGSNLDKWKAYALEGIRQERYKLMERERRIMDRAMLAVLRRHL